jgi:hypothetical protein
MVAFCPFVLDGLMGPTGLLGPCEGLSGSAPFEILVTSTIRLPLNTWSHGGEGRGWDSAGSRAARAVRGWREDWLVVGRAHMLACSLGGSKGRVRNDFVRGSADGPRWPRLPCSVGVCVRVTVCAWSVSVWVGPIFERSHENAPSRASFRIILEPRPFFLAPRIESVYMCGTGTLYMYCRPRYIVLQYPWLPRACLSPTIPLHALQRLRSCGLGTRII